MLIRLLTLIISNALAIYTAAWLIPGISFAVTPLNLFFAGLTLGVANSTIRPLLKILSFPVIILTLGLFTVIINALVLLIVSSFFDFFTIHSFLSALLGTFVISFVNSIINSLEK